MTTSPDHQLDEIINAVNNIEPDIDYKIERIKQIYHDKLPFGMDYHDTLFAIIIIQQEIIENLKVKNI
jgi:hypothetical protein